MGKVIKFSKHNITARLINKVIKAIESPLCPINRGKKELSIKTLNLLILEFLKIDHNNAN